MRMAVRKSTEIQSETSAAADYRKLFESLPNGYIAFLPNDPVFTVVAENKAHAQMSTVKTTNTVGMPLREVLAGISEGYMKADVIESVRRAIKTGKPDTMPIINYHSENASKNTTTKYWRITHFPVFDDTGKLELMYQMTEDITDEEVTSNKLQRAQHQLDEALSIGLIGTWLWDIDTDRVIGDANMADMFGVSAKAAAKGLPASAFTHALHPDDQPRVQKEIAAALKSGEIFHSEYRTVGREGAIRWVIAHGRIERDKFRSLTFPGVLVDITDRKLIENNFSYLAKVSRMLSESLDHNKTLQTIARLMVPDIADWCGVEMLNEHGQLDQVAVAHKDPAKVEWAIELRKKQGPPDLNEPSGVSNVLRTGKSEYYPLISDELLVASAKSKKELKLLRDLALTSVIIVPLKISNKTVGAISLITTDNKRIYSQSDLEMAEEVANRASLAMTNAHLYDDAQKELAARTKLEEALRIANEELENRVESRTLELENTNLNLKRSNQELQDFAYVASHDLQEPLRKIQAFGNLLETEYGSVLGDGKDYLTRMRNAAARMSAHIEDILSFSRITTKAREFTSVNLGSVVEGVMSDLEVRVAETNATVHIGNLPTIQADSMQMRQLMQNVIANALKFQRDGVAPVVQIQATVEKDPNTAIKYCRLEIQDNGLGFDEKYLDRIFAVFQRLHDSQ